LGFYFSLQSELGSAVWTNVCGISSLLFLFQLKKKKSKRKKQWAVSVEGLFCVDNHQLARKNKTKGWRRGRAKKTGGMPLNASKFTLLFSGMAGFFALRGCGAVGRVLSGTCFSLSGFVNA
jgi:hypothetical protein